MLKLNYEEWWQVRDALEGRRRVLHRHREELIKDLGLKDSSDLVSSHSPYLRGEIQELDHLLVGIRA